MNVEPCLYLRGQCEETLDFYREVLVAEVLFMKMRDNPYPQQIRLLSVFSGAIVG